MRLRCVYLLIAAAGTIRAQTLPSDQELIRRLASQVEALEKRIHDLESRPVTGPAVEQVVASAPEAAILEQTPPDQTILGQTKPDETQTSHDGHDAHDSLTAGPGLRIRGFGDFGYFASHGGASSNSFSLGQLDLFITSRLSDHLGFLMETVFEHDDANATGVDIERALLQYHPSRYFNMDVGRYHSTIGYYNSAFHHGTWFQTAVGRPALFSFEDSGGVLPIHNVGVSFAGRIPSGASNLGYAFELGNGRTYQPGVEQVLNKVDNNRGKSFNLAISARPSAWPGLRVGASFYRDKVSLDDAAFHQNILSAHAVYQIDRTEFLNEVVWMRHVAAGSTTSIPGLYSQLAYRFGVLRPYLRYEWMNAPGGDPVVLATGHTPGVTQKASGGVRYDFSEFAAFKVQFGNEWQSVSGESLQAAIQFAFTF